MGTDHAALRRTIVEEAKKQARNHAIVALTWHPLRPTDDLPANDAKSLHAQLTDFEWEQLLTPGTDLYNHWAAQVD